MLYYLRAIQNILRTLLAGSQVSDCRPSGYLFFHGVAINRTFSISKVHGSLTTDSKVIYTKASCSLSLKPKDTCIKCYKNWSTGLGDSCSKVSGQDE